MKTGKAIKKPIPVEFILLENTSQSILEVNKFIESKDDIGHTSSNYANEKWFEYVDSCKKQGGIFLKTLESDGQTQKANFGDYILKGIEGECWPIKADIFERTYDII